MKKPNWIYKSFFTLMLILGLLVATPAFAKTVIIEENNLNVRSGPSTEYERIGQVHQGEQYEIIEEEENWVKIRFNHLEGWVIKDYISIQEDESLFEEQEEHSSTEAVEDKEVILDLPTEKIVIQKDNTHLRSGPGTSFDIIAFVNEGERFDVLQEIDDWLEITNGDLTGYVLRSNVETIPNRTSGIQDKTIVIDAGHGGRDVGAIGINEIYEKDITYLTARILEKELKALGAQVILTRAGDEFVPLESRSTLANAIDADAFLSIHYNSFPEVPSVTGIETYYFHEQDKSLANFIHEGIIMETSERDRGIATESFFVIRQTFKPSVLLELGFLSNPENSANLQTTGYQMKIVSGIINGLQKYFQ